MTELLVRKLLSRQQHYDWGLRALKSVLRTAGDELAKQNLTDVALDVDSVEYSAAVRALNFNTLSKLTTADSAVFLGLIADMFPMAKHLHDSEHAKLLEIIAECCSEMGLAFIDQQVGYERNWEIRETVILLCFHFLRFLGKKSFTSL